MDIKAINKILHNGKMYGAGDKLTGLSDEEAKRLVVLKDGIEVDQEILEVKADSLHDLSEGKILPEDLDDDSVALTTEEFEKLNAQEQKDELQLLGIEPAGKEAERIEQYKKWYESEDQ
ncbi:hypothetical protein [Paenibacillus sp. Marseille-Q4541]|uniref:DUF7210 family protein n=1 Tax=Paenibacillus sp. Marseille-Q4541 TaxID=2831522 RepID=UPI001BA5CED0|nr:hypothetical protein [Paenibacillus sp. Marseille-Q4541]